ncbi:MAG: PaaI family thioesterase [Pseudomonadota bacterium]
MPDDRALLTQVFPQPGNSSASLGFHLLALDMTALTTRVRFDGKSDFTNPAGYIQGGYLSAMLDDTIGMLATMKTGTVKFPSTIDLHTTFLRPVKVGAIEVAARLRNIGRAVIFADAELYDTRGKEAARAVATLAINPRKAPAS